eukprot:TRINITY_DN2182_c0_g1_i1.p1 TRINITY_DN2182_c0_g1~~TRINITY_DN2182_c0_g1_i1.p1  ORF type:complete len:197 (-),score=26.72 TRINITY_DN2182_c0_g1_i1:675-1265(-)
MVVIQSKVNKGVRAKKVPKQTGPKVIHSNFFVTINTNYRAKSDSDFEDFQEEFRDALDDLYGSIKIIKQVRIHKDRPKGQKTEDVKVGDPDAVDLSEAVKTMKSETQIEEGSTKKGGRVHSHSVLEISHTTVLLVDLDYIRDHFKERFPDLETEKGFHIDVKMINNSMKNVLSYVRKTVELREGELEEAYKKLSIK